MTVKCRCCRKRVELAPGRTTGYGPVADLCRACWDDPANEMAACKHGESSCAAYCRLPLSHPGEHKGQP